MPRSSVSVLMWIPSVRMLLAPPSCKLWAVPGNVGVTPPRTRGFLDLLLRLRLTRDADAKLLFVRTAKDE